MQGACRAYARPPRRPVPLSAAGGCRERQGGAGLRAFCAQTPQEKGGVIDSTRRYHVP